uniref:O-acyltransferase like n=1 Tax=Salarias fasciatus TaxID=181472 RepID=A0A672HPR3_SALFA
MALGQAAFLLLVWGCVAVENAPASAVSQRCMMDTDTFLRELKQDRPKEYAVLMFDAFGKMGSNVEGGNANQPGLLRQCRSARGPEFSGQYLFLSLLSQGTIQYFVGLCVPDSCREEEVQLLVLQFHQISLVPPLPSILANESTQEMIMTHCLSNTIDPDASDVASFGTGLNLYGALRTNGPSDKEDESSTSEDNGKNKGFHRCVNNSSLLSSPSTMFPFAVGSDPRRLRSPESGLHRCLQAFSLQAAARGVLGTSSAVPGGGHSSLNGIRVFSLLWIICGHSAQFPVINNLDNYKTWKTTVESSPLYVFTISGPVFLAVDTFLLLGGLLSARSLLCSIKKLLLCINCRIQPLHVFIMCLTIGLISLVHWGPYWFPFINTLMDCKTYWWANLLLIICFHLSPQCIPWTWYLSLDFQCYATTPLLVFLYRLNKGVFAVVAGLLLHPSSYTVKFLFNISLAFLYSECNVFKFCRTSEKYVLSYYVKPYTRYGPFLIGVLTGIYLTTKEYQLLKHKVSMALVVGLAYVMRETPADPSTPHALYQGLHRPVWALSVAWIVLACEEGYGGYINKLLSLNIWVPLSNISFACYLVHPVFIILYIGLQETPIHYMDINFMYLFLGHLVLTVAVSYVLTVLIERPYLLLKW